MDKNTKRQELWTDNHIKQIAMNKKNMIYGQTNRSNRYTKGINV